MKISLALKIIFCTTLAIFIPLLISLFLTPDIFILISASFLSAVVLAGLIFLFLKPLKKLISSAEGFAAGNFNKRSDIRSGDELETVADSFNQVLQKFSQDYHSLETNTHIAVAENSKLSEILSSIIDGIIALDFNKNIILVNKAAEQLTGYTQSELKGQPVEKLVHLFVDNEEINSKSYCQLNFNKSVLLVGKEGRQTKINLMTSQVDGTVQTNISCILIMHDLSKEEELERMKLDFVSMASHELKTPLTSIISYLSVFAGENRGKLPKEEWDLIDRSLISAKQLLVLVQNLLNVNNIEREQMSVTPEPLDYQPIILKAVEDLKSQANQKNILLTLTLPKEPLPKVLADPIRISEVLTNLIANALNYTNPGGKVDISLQVSPNEITTIVSDTGVGIPKEATLHLFNKFFRVSNQNQKSSKGTGLGLYISKSIIEKLNGKIWVESEAGMGSKFYFTLPVVTLSSGILDSRQFVGKEIQSGGLNY